MRHAPIPRPNNLQKGVRVRRPPLQLHRQRRKQQYLHRGPRSVPERPRDTIAVAHARALEEGRGPGPGGHNCGSDEARLCRAACRGEHFRGLALAFEAAEDVGCGNLRGVSRSVLGANIEVGVEGLPL